MSQKLSRRAARENAFKVAFASTFCAQTEEEQGPEAELDDCELDDFARELLEGYRGHREEIDDIITTHLKGWTLQRLPRVSLTVLRIALSEILYGQEKLPGVAINEAVELTKRYGAEGDYQFVNGVLGAVAQELALPEEKPEPSTEEG